MSAAPAGGEKKGWLQSVWRFAGILGDFVLLNFLFLLCSLPVVTVGQAATALNAVQFARIEHREGKLVPAFFRGMKEDFLQGVLLTLVSFMAVAGLYADVRIMQANGYAFPFVAWVLLILAAIVVGFTIPYVFAIRARYQNTFGQTLKKAFILSFVHPLQSILAAMLAFLPIALFLFATYYFIFTSIWWFLGGFSVTSYLTGLLLLPIFRRQECAGNAEEEEHAG